MNGRPTDDQVCAALDSGDVSAMAAVYEAYADRLFSYALGVTRNRELAADAVSDALLLAHARFHQLRDRSKLRAWLYAICRNECLRGLRAASRIAALDSAGEVADMSTDLEAGIAADDARQLIESAFEGMNQADRELIELALRQELSPTQIGEVIGVSANNASARLSAAKAQLERAVGALLLWRSKGSSCPDLRKIVSGQSFTPLLRKRIARHSENCDECSNARRRAVAAIAIVSLPIIAAPAWLKGAFLAGQPSTVAFASPLGSIDANPAAMGRRAELLDRDRLSFDDAGWPRITRAARRWPVVLAATGSCLVVIGIVLGFWLDLGHGGGGTAVAGVASSSSAEVVTSTSSGSASASRSRSTRSPSPTRSASTSSSRTPSGSATTTTNPTRSPSSSRPSKSPTTPSTSQSPSVSTSGKSPSTLGPNDPGYTYPGTTSGAPPIQ